MAYIPYESTIDARTGRSGGGRLRNAFDADALGAGAGRGMMEAGQGLERVGVDLTNEVDRKAEEQAVHARSMFDFSDELNRIKQETGADAEGYKDTVREAYISRVSEYTDNIDDDLARIKARDGLLARLPAITNEADTYQQTVRLNTTKERTNEALNANRNKVLSDPSSFQEALALSQEAIQVYGAALPKAAVEEMQRSEGYNLSKSYFQARLNQARKPSEYEAVASEMNSDEWRDKLLSRDFEDLTNKIEASKKTVRTQANAEARSALSSVEEQLKDPTRMPDAGSLSALQSLVKDSDDPSLLRKVARVNRDVELMGVARKMNRMQLSEAKASIQSKTAGSPFVDSAYKASAVTGMSVPFLVNLSGAEYRPGGPEKNPGSTATGPTQFLEGTFLDLIKDPANAEALGVQPNMTREQVLSLRSNPDTAFMAAAIYAKQNKLILETKFKRQMTDPELYFAHLLGPAGAEPIIAANQANPAASARSLVSDEVYNVNKAVFTDKETGRDYTVAELYGNYARKFSSDVGVVDFEDLKVFDTVETAIKSAQESGTLLEYAVGVGVLPQLTPLDQPNGFRSRGAAAQTVSDYFGVEVPPFTPAEMAYLNTQLNGGLNQRLGVLDNIASMERPVARRALAQLKQENPAAGQAGQLLLQGDRATASMVLSGMIRLKDNPSLPTAIGFDEKLSSLQFQSVIGQSTAMWNPQDTEALKRAADAYYLEKLAVSGGKYSDSDYKKTVSKVFGFETAKINGYDTVLPRGVSQNQINLFLDHVEPAELMAMSRSGTRPMVSPDGKRLSTPDFKDVVPSARLVNVGPGVYRMYPPVGNVPYLSGVYDEASRMYLPYDIELSPEKIGSVATRVSAKYSRKGTPIDVGPML